MQKKPDWKAKKHHPFDETGRPVLSSCAKDMYTLRPDLFFVSASLLARHCFRAHLSLIQSPAFKRLRRPAFRGPRLSTLRVERLGYHHPTLSEESFYSRAAGTRSLGESRQRERPQPRRLRLLLRFSTHACFIGWRKKVLLPGLPA